MSNPLFPKSDSTGIEAAWEEAVWMDDCDKQEEERKKQQEDEPHTPNVCQQANNRNATPATGGILKPIFKGFLIFIILLAIIFAL